MRALAWSATLGLVLCACSRAPVDEGLAAHGRYVGVGTYAAGELWRKVAVAAPNSPSVATTADDEHVIVVVDTRTGEVRECGDYSGACVGFSPWSHALAAAQTGPVTVTQHLADLEKERQAAQPAQAK